MGMMLICCSWDVENVKGLETTAPERASDDQLGAKILEKSWTHEELTLVSLSSSCVHFFVFLTTCSFSCGLFRGFSYDISGEITCVCNVSKCWMGLEWAPAGTCSGKEGSTAIQEAVPAVFSGRIFGPPRLGAKFLSSFTNGFYSLFFF